MTVGNVDIRSAEERLDAFAEELSEVQGWDVERHPSEVDVGVLGDEETLTTDLREVLQTGHDYSLVAFDGQFGNSVGTLHFKPVEEVYGETANKD